MKPGVDLIHDPIRLVHMPAQADYLADTAPRIGDPAFLELGIEMSGALSAATDRAAAALRIGLIDGHRLSQECLIKAFKGLHPQMDIAAFATVQACIAQNRADLNLILYCTHASDGADVATAQEIAALRQAFGGIPLIVMSDAEDAHQPRTIRTTLRSGAHGFIPARTTGLAMTFAAMRFVAAGGTFAPLDPLLANRPERAPAVPDAARQCRLTSRQLAVLSHLQQGKANKIIAHELGMSQSTVKVHVRNIMRKMGATNRTQAAFKAQKLWSGNDFARAGEL